MFSCLGYLEEGDAVAAAIRRRQKNYERRVDITRLLYKHARIYTNICVRFTQIKITLLFFVCTPTRSEYPVRLIIVIIVKLNDFALYCF